MDMPMADIRRILSSVNQLERQDLIRDHRARLEARLDEVRGLLVAVDALTEENVMSTDTCISSWLQLMPRIP